jgi:hypothetical protein
MEIAQAPGLSEPIKLSPGIHIDGRHIKEAVVRLLTRSDRKAAVRMGAEERDDFLFIRSIHSLGDVTDQSIIAEAAAMLATPDESRLRVALSLLEAQHMEAPELREEERQLRIKPPECDIVSEVFALNPGFTFKGKEYKTAAVRLLTRGQWKAINAEPEEGTRETMSLLYSVAEVGGEKPTAELLARIADTDNERLVRAGEELRAHYALGSKSALPGLEQFILGGEPGENSD